MHYLELPGLPQKPVTLAVVDGRINERMGDALAKRGITVIKTPKYPGLYEAISYHPDMMIHPIGGEKIVYAPGIDVCFLDVLSGYGFKMIKGASTLSSQYPFNIAYNVARVGNFALHNKKYTDPILKNELKKADIQIIDVKQGYTKCSVSIVNHKSIITSDKGIAKTLENKDLEVLLIESDENIRLNGLNYGFIGGCTGLIDKCVWAITGDIKMLPSALKIKHFIEARNIRIECLSDECIEDIGSIIPLATV